MRLIARRTHDGAALSIGIADGRITRVEPTEQEASLFVAPPLLDIQVNGYGGYDFNAPEPTPEIARQAVLALGAVGVGGCLPTITTGSFAHTGAALRAVVKAAAEDVRVGHAVVGIHLEGPYISPEDGPRGAHPREHVRLPDADEFARFQEAASGRIRLVTLAPELPGALTLIERLVGAGIVVAVGHHMATAEQLDDAVRAGARLATHLGNGAHAVLPRHPNYLWDQLGDDRLAASFILDGHHLPAPVARCMLRAKGMARSILVSDAVFLAGLPPQTAAFMGRRVELTAEGRVNLAGTPYLAGAALPLAAGVANAVRFAGLSLADAIGLATANPALLLGLGSDWGALVPGRAANLLLFEWDGATMRPAALLARGDVVGGKVPA